jgi:DNA-binding response OmpR family regulator
MTQLSPDPAARHHVLIVDDEVAVCQAATDYLSAYGFRVDTAQELEQAESMLASSAYALVIADVRLTGIHGREGLELVRFVRRRFPNVGIIVMTAHASPELEREAQQRGADMFLEKPLPLSELLVRARRVLDTRHQPTDPT